MKRRYKEEKQYVNKLCNDNTIYPIYPNTSTTFVSVFERDLDKINELYNIGYQCGVQNIDKLREYLN